MNSNDPGTARDPHCPEQRHSELSTISFPKAFFTFIFCLFGICVGCLVGISPLWSADSALPRLEPHEDMATVMNELQRARDPARISPALATFREVTDLRTGLDIRPNRPGFGHLLGGGRTGAFMNKRELMNQAMDIAPQVSLADYDIKAHADEVSAQLGTIPSFNVFELGKVVPMTKDGVEIPFGQHLGSACDKPPLLPLDSSDEAGQTVPYTRVGRLPTSTANVVWVFIARRYKIRPIDDPLFEDVAIIGHNKVTGATAFFQHLSEGTNATRVPSPMEPASDTPAGKITARDFWLRPEATASISCFQCHDADVWIHTPFIDQVKLGNGTQLMVPAGPVGTTENPPSPHPYSFIGTKFFTQWPNPMKHMKPQNNQCISCHRIGSERRNTSFYLSATGREIAGFPGYRLSNTAKAYPASHMMPPHVSEMESQARWDTLYKSSVDQIISYKLDPTQPGANLTPVEPPPHP